jgi:2'-5' RNA ligase
MKMYFVAILAPEKINADALKWKLYFREKFGCRAALHSPAHITLVPPFWMKE